MILSIYHNALQVSLRRDLAAPPPRSNAPQGPRKWRWALPLRLRAPE